MASINSCNNQVACEPFSTTEVTTSKSAPGSKYVAVVEAANSLEGLRVVYGDGNVPTNSTIYVLSTHKSSAWASPANTVEFKGKKIIFVPVSEIKLLELPPPPDLSAASYGFGLKQALSAGVLFKDNGP